MAFIPDDSSQLGFIVLGFFNLGQVSTNAAPVPVTNPVAVVSETFVTQAIIRRKNPVAIIIFYPKSTLGAATNTPLSEAPPITP